MAESHLIVTLLPDFQFGFRAKHDTTLQVARITHEITDNFSKDKNTAMALLDIRKAFDRVWFEGLTFKLLNIGVPSLLVRLLRLVHDRADATSTDRD